MTDEQADQPDALDRLVDALVAECRAGCCDGREWHGYMCNYHAGFADGAEAMVTALVERMP